MNSSQSSQKSEEQFRPRDLLRITVVTNIIVGMLMFRYLAMALFMNHPRQFAAASGVVLFVFAWRSRRWIPSLLFLLFTVGFWLAVILPLGLAR